MTPQMQTSKTQLLNAALTVIRTAGYAGTTVEDICRVAGVTKGSFFHHFKSKDELALAAVQHWETTTEALFASAPYHEPKDPLERLLGYVDFRSAMLSGEIPDFTCLLGTLVQETYDTHPAIRQACERSMTRHIEVIVKDAAAAKALYAPSATWTAESVGFYIQSVLQGSFIFAKAQQSSAVVLDNLEHLRRYLQLIFQRTH
jgi:TetR/AcrR family transcriptional regulator, transcriptional repressor for nem operon